MNSAKKSYLGLRGTRLKGAMLLCVVIPCFLLFGYNNGSTGGVTTLNSFVTQFPSLNTATTTGVVKQHNAKILGVVTGCYDLGAVVGSLTTIAYGDKIGRLRTILIGLVLSLVALAIETSAYSVAQFVVGRLLIGCAIGIISAAVPVWQAECSGAAHRGAFVMVEGLCISGGITLTEWISFGLQFATKGSGNWRGTMVFPAVFALFSIPFVLMMPESPRWLARKGRYEEARRVLSALEDTEPDSPMINKEMAEMQHSLEEVKGSFFEMFSNGRERVFNRLLLAMTGQMFQQFCGISALVFYTTSLFSTLGYKGTHARILACSLSTFQTVSSVVPLFTIDRFGRRALFLFSATGMCICMAIVAATGGSTNHSISTVAVAFIFIYDFFFPIGMLGLTFLYATEVAPLRFRVPITATANATQWLCQFVVAQITPPGTASLGSKYYAIWAATNFCFIPIVYLFFPETKARNLEEVDYIFEQSTNALQPPRVAKRTPRRLSIDDEGNLAPHMSHTAQVGGEKMGDKGVVYHNERV